MGFVPLPSDDFPARQIVPSATDDWRLLYPFESRELTLGGHRCHYVDEGRGPCC